MWLQATSTPAPPTLLNFFLALLLKNVDFTMTALGAFPSSELCSSPVAPHQWLQQLQSCFGQHLPMSAHWPRSIVHQGWPWGRSSGFSLSGRASYQLSQSNLGDICRSWSCDDARHQYYLGLPGASCIANAAVAVAHMTQKFLSLPQSGWHVGGQDARARYCIFKNVSRQAKHPTFPLPIKVDGLGTTEPGLLSCWSCRWPHS